MQQAKHIWPGTTGRNLKFSLLNHITETQSSHFDLVLELQPGRRLWTLKSESNPLKSDSCQLSIHGFIRRRYLRFAGDIGRGRGVVKQVYQGGTYTATSVKDGTLLAFTLREGKSIIMLLTEGNGVGFNARLKNAG